MRVAAIACVAVGLTSLAPAGHDGTAGILKLNPASDSLIATLTNMSVSPTSAPGSLAKLAATEAATNGAHPAGWVQFQVGNTDIGPPVPVSSAGTASTSAAILGLAQAATSLSATFTPATSAYLASATTAAVTAQAAGTEVGSIAVTLAVPLGGNFTVAVPRAAVTLQESARSGVATGSLQSATVSEGRNWAPGWSATGQQSDFTGRRGAKPRTIASTQFGWVPTGTVVDGAKLGPAVPPGDPSLGGAGAVLAAAATGSGLGTQILSADLTLIIPAGAAGSYSGVLTITYLESASLPAASASQNLLPQTG